MKELISFGKIGESHIFGIPIELGIGPDRHIPQKDRFCERTSIGEIGSGWHPSFASSNPFLVMAF
jgi:hypothetical protein